MVTESNRPVIAWENFWTGWKRCPTGAAAFSSRFSTASFQLGRNALRECGACPGGTFENSPAFQRRERWTKNLRPEGTVEVWVERGWRFNRPFGTGPGRWTPPSVETPGYNRMSLRDSSTNSRRTSGSITLPCLKPTTIGGSKRSPTGCPMTGSSSPKTRARPRHDYVRCPARHRST